MSLQREAAEIENRIKEAYDQNKIELSKQKALLEEANAELRSKQAHGDTSENATHADAKQKHDNAIEEILRRQKRDEAYCNYFKDNDSTTYVPTGRIGLKTTVKLRLMSINNSSSFKNEIQNDGIFILKMVPHDMGDFFHQLLAEDSVVGCQLMGRIIDNSDLNREVTINSHKGEIKYYIEEIY